jgi:hypothetical protein
LRATAPVPGHQRREFTGRRRAGAYAELPLKNVDFPNISKKYCNILQNVDKNS